MIAPRDYAGVLVAIAFVAFVAAMVIGWIL